MLNTHLTPEQLRELEHELRLEGRRLAGHAGERVYDATVRALASVRNAKTPPAMAGAPAAATNEPTASDSDQQPDEFDIAAARVAGAPDRLLRILEALRRLRSGQYGICCICRTSIPFARLLAIPETATCVRCSWSGSPPPAA
ncbi:MAG TPA: hypothetical protein VFS33_08570 [Gemmatimonadales bacterium]|nr:hypothetical protein [Gemmatimonadales bacterium]